MFAARGVIVCLAFFAVTYGMLSCLVGATWLAGRQLRPRQSLNSPSVLFAIRILPFAVSALVGVFFTFPSFWLMEGKSLDEDVTTFLLAACALVLLSAGLVRALNATRRTKHATAQWLSKSGDGSDVHPFTLSSAADAPPLMLVGVWRPKVMISDMAAAVLSENELRLAVRHELEHKRSWDNLKKLLMNATPFPGMGGIEKAWREAAELAADDSAVETRQDALDLAMAIIKLSRSATRWTEPENASALVFDPSAVATRVYRLLQWRTARRLNRTWPWAVLAILFITVIVGNYSTALVMTHRLTQLLVP